MMQKKFNRVFLTLAVLVVAGSSVAWAGKNEDRFRALLSAPRVLGNGSDVSGKADFRERGSRRQFSVEIEGFKPGQLFDVMIAGEVVGTVLIDKLGVGQLDFDDRADPFDLDEPFPPGFPAINGGELVQVGNLSGTLQPKQSAMSRSAGGERTLAARQAVRIGHLHLPDAVPNRAVGSSISIAVAVSLLS